MDFSQEKTEVIDTGKQTIRQEANALSRIAELLDHNFYDATELLSQCKGKIIISGMGKSGIIGQKIAATLSSTGTTALFLHPAEAAHGDLGVVSKEDCVICLSKSGMTEELNFILPALRKIGVSILAFTGNKRSYLAEKADIVLDVSVEQEACPFDLAPTTSTTAMLAMGDALAMCLMKMKQFTHHDFAVTHPKGSLGKRLTMKVSDIMATAEALPLVEETALLTDIILEMTSKRFGMSGITDNAGRLTGVFTDGDLRRLIQSKKDILSLQAKDVMTKGPKTVTADTLAEKCLRILESHRITQLLVCDKDNHPVGIIHIHDLITLGL
ncbi:KpsF/GutQ family sugar-phosphate isomerase [Prosthecochloris sp. SCSIO W1103]|uniref:KpsF/GutQ family sugar-phosphate isomerase n=1 Tax=Prosthecochloris sp. SCSIO W1103 TaxID=2992244 RepID=UPI00223DA2B5|nr:KpsF/GutQ family sugar-phosphate isomerase [Prosthecochloris sp. SCSIO W1103]UZJ37220.1 KpsF/GutQ family sugar-phosphate isomerase [Prosthecochloris sp. SCSIO W1103]